MIVVPYVKSVDDIASIRSFLNKNKGESVKIIMKVMMSEALDSLELFLPHIDAFLIYEQDIDVLIGEKKSHDVIDHLIEISNTDGRPVIVGIDCKKLTSKTKIDDCIKHYIAK